MGRTLAEKVWDAHVVRSAPGEPDLLYIDLHLIHEVTSPQAFDGLRTAGRPVRRPDLTLATEDHNVPTIDIDKPIADPVSRAQVDALRANAAEFGVPIYSLGSAEQGIVHVVGPQLGLTQPGMTIVCGDSHTSTHGAFGALAFGIGTSEVEHVLATQTLPLKPFRTMAITVEGALPEGVTAKDLILAVIARIGTGGGQGYVLEYRGEAIRALSMEARMTICNMSIEAGARAGMIAPDETTFAYVEGRDEGADRPGLARCGGVLAHAGHRRRRGVRRRGRHRRQRAEPVRHLGDQPRPGRAAVGDRPGSCGLRRPLRPGGCPQGPGVHGADGGHPDARHPCRHRVPGLLHQRADRGPAGGGRDPGGSTGRRWRAHAGRLPGSVRVRLAAMAEGLDRVFIDAGAEWREAGCSMCLGMNPDTLAPQERSASTSNRNFEGRQGPGGRTHLVSPQVAAATAVRGTLSSPADLA